MNDAALIIFTRNPELGKCKTRLAATIGDVNALGVYRLLIEHTVSITQDLPFDRYVYYSEEIPSTDSWSNAHHKKALQSNGDLGHKMQTAFQELFAKGYRRVAIIGSDLFDLQREDLLKGIELLSTADVVLGPAHDGGYYFLGLKAVLPELFKNKDWGTDSVLKATLADLSDKKVAMLPVRNDIDYFEDIKDRDEFKRFIPAHLR